MKPFAVVLLGLLSLATVTAGDGLDRASQMEAEKLQGEWKQVRIERKGSEFKSKIEVLLVIDGEKWVYVAKSKIEKRVALDPTQNPRVIDMIGKGKDGN